MPIFKATVGHRIGRNAQPTAQNNGRNVHSGGRFLLRSPDRYNAVQRRRTKNGGGVARNDGNRKQCRKREFGVCHGKVLPASCGRQPGLRVGGVPIVLGVAAGGRNDGVFGK